MEKMFRFLPRSKRNALCKWLCDKFPTVLLCCMLLSSVVTAWVTFKVTKAVTSKNQETHVTEEVPAPVEVDAEERMDLVETTLQDNAQEQARMEAESIARVLYGMRGNDKDDLKKVAWVIINRCESPLYPNTIAGVCEQPSQWVGYYDNNPILEDLFDLSLEVVNTWRDGGHRPFSPEYLWFNWSRDYIEFKNRF